MRSFLALLLALLTGSCATADALPGARYVAEDLRHVVTIRTFETDAAAAAEVESLRSRPGNLAVLLLRRDGRILVLAEWRSAEEARRGGMAGEEYDVLFEAAEFDAGEQ
jgi:hypothetical protein